MASSPGKELITLTPVLQSYWQFIAIGISPRPLWHWIVTRQADLQPLGFLEEIIMSLPKQSSNIQTFSCGDSLVTNDFNKANCLNNHLYNYLIASQQTFTNPLPVL